MKLRTGIHAANSKITVEETIALYGSNIALTENLERSTVEQRATAS